MNRILLFTVCFFYIQISSGQGTKIDSVKLSYQNEKKAIELRQKGKYLSAAAKLKKAIVLLPDLNNEKKIQLHYDVGYCFQLARAIDSAKYHYTQGDALINETTSDSTHTFKNLNIASLFYTQQNIDSAMVYSLRSLDFSLKTNNSKLKSITYGNIGSLFLYQKNLDKASEYLTIAQKHAQNSKDSLTIIGNLTKLGLLYFEQKELDLSETTLNLSIDFYERKHNTKGILIAKGYLTKVFFDQGKLQESYAVAVELLPIINEMELIGDAKKIVDNTNEIHAIGSRDSLNAEDVLQAKRLSEENISITNPSPVTIEQNKAILSYVEKSDPLPINNKSTAYEDGQLEAKLESTVKQLDSSYQVALNGKYLELETKYQTQKKENEILQLEQVETEQQLELSKRKTQNVFLGSTAILGGIGFLCLFLYARNRKRKLVTQNQLQIIKVKDEQSNQIAIQLHDGKARRLFEISEELQSGSNLKLSQELADMGNNIRDLSYDLKKIPFDESELDRQLTTLAAKNNSTIMRIKLMGHKDINWVRWDDAVKRNIYIIVREAITNIKKHADADNVNIKFKKERGKLLLSIEDNGKGFDSQPENFGMGLTSMKIRVKELDGKIKITSIPNKGTNIFIQLTLV